MPGPFIDPDATENLAVTDTDTVTIRTEFGQGDINQITRAMVPQPGSFDASAARWKLIEIGVKAWSFDRPLTRENLELLHPEIADKIANRLDELYDASRSTLPNPSGGPSRPSSPATVTAGPNRATRRATRR